jgi:hypothetical protein
MGLALYLLRQFVLSLETLEWHHYSKGKTKPNIILRRVSFEWLFEKTDLFKEIIKNEDCLQQKRFEDLLIYLKCASDFFLLGRAEAFRILSSGTLASAFLQK